MIAYDLHGAEVTRPPAMVVPAGRGDHSLFRAFEPTSETDASTKDEPWLSRGGEGSSNTSFSVVRTEVFDWTSKRVFREYVQLEQLVAAGKATQEEESRYRKMKASRNAQIFAARVVRDYGEIQRLRVLSAKLAELNTLIRPFQI